MLAGISHGVWSLVIVRHLLGFQSDSISRGPRAHTDSQGAEQSNLILSKKRAEAVRDYLESRGVARERMVVQFFGEEQPKATNDTPEGREENRRVDMTVIFD